MRLLKTFILFSCVFVLFACTDGDKKVAPDGERISVLDLQKKLQPDITPTEKLKLPLIWDNEYWPQAGGYPGHTLQHVALNSDSLQLAWKTSIGKGSSGGIPLNAAPVIVDGKVFTLDSKNIVSAFSVENGKRLWQQDIQSPAEDEIVITGGLAYEEGQLFATNGSNELVTLDARNGTINWRKTIPSPSRAAPTILNDRIYVSTLDNQVIALSAEDGKILWDYQGLTESAGIFGGASAAANQDIVVPVFSSGEVSALRVANGSVAWSDNLSGLKRFGGLNSLSDIRALPVIDQGLVFVMNYGGRIVAIDERSGQRIWQRDIGGVETPWLADAYLFIISADNELIALTRNKGEIIWVSELPKYKDPKDREGLISWMGPVLADGRLYITGSTGQVLLLSPHDGTVLRQIKVGDPIAFPPIIAGKTLYLLTENGTLLAYK